MAEEKGIHVRNATRYIQACKAAKDFKFVLKPGAQTYIPAEFVDNVTIRKMIRRGLIEEVTVEDALASEEASAEQHAEERAAAHEAVMDSLDRSSDDDLVQVQCAAITKAGNQCKKMVMVRVKDRDNEAFCKTHEKA